MTSAMAHYDKLELSYGHGETADDIRLYPNLALLDFQLRFTVLCAAAGLRAEGHPVNLSRTAGIGVWIATLKRALPLLRTSSSLPALIELVSSVLDAVNGFQGLPGMQTLKKVRDHVTHGFPVLEGEGRAHLATATDKAARRISESIRSFLDKAEASHRPTADSSLDTLRISWGRKHLDLWPFIGVDAGDWCLYGSCTATLPTYLRFGHGDSSVTATGESLLYALKESLAANTRGSAFTDFIADVHADLGGFRDLDYEPHYYTAEASIITFVWVRAFGEGSKERLDNFRIGADHERQWERSPGDWQPYSTFLRDLAFWPVLAKRIRQQMRALEERMADEERIRLGWARSTATVESPIRYSTLDRDDFDDVTPQRRAVRFHKLREDIDNGLSTKGPCTAIIFVTGEAGAGKTRALVKAALDRAQEVEREPSDTADHLPLYLYVRSTGQALESLQTAINDAVTSTRNLTQQGVLALCRNGLMALFIDGFDELLGGVGYDDALGSLRTWIEALNGSGVLVISARSSYYLNQYQSSLRRRSDKPNIAVTHRIAHLQRWNDSQVLDFVKQFGLSKAALSTLSNEDRELLGLPFFARVFVEDQLNPAAGGEQRSLPERLLDQYLVREEAKLPRAGGRGEPLLSRTELQTLFQGIAELMAERHEREVTLDDVALQAGLAIGDFDLDSRHGLKDRLSVLCGVSTQRNRSTSEQRFSFQHEIFYDQFLAGAVLQHLVTKDHQVNEAPVYKVLAATEWRAATVSGIIARASEQVLSLLRGAAGHLGKLDGQRRQTFQANLGSLWVGLARHSRNLDDEHVREVVFETLDLTAVSCQATRFNRCRFGTLLLPPTGQWNIHLIDCSIATMRVAPGVESLAGLSGLELESVGQVLTANSLADSPRKIHGELSRLGVVLDPIEDGEPTGRLAEAATFFLGKIATRVDTLVVHHSGAQIYQDASERLSWTRNYGDGTWATFIRLLEQTKLIDIHAKTTGGSPKARVQFLVDAATIQNRDSDEPGVQRFWELIDAER